jgi:hypothetical protein
MADRKEVDMVKLDRLAQLPIRAEDIAYVLEVSTDTLSRRIKETHGTTFAEYLEQKRATIRYSLMAKQFDLALKGNVTLLIWLGKQYLDQKDKLENTNKNEPLAQLPDADLEEKIKRLMAKAISNAPEPGRED